MPPGLQLAQSGSRWHDTNFSSSIINQVNCTGMHYLRWCSILLKVEIFKN